MGAGSIGCYLAGKLLVADAADVVLVGRPRLARDIAVSGLVVRGVAGEGAVAPERVRFETEPGALSACDAVLVCVKSAQTAEVSTALKPILRRDALVVSMQNGLRNAERLAERFTEGRVVPAVVGFNVVNKGGGVFHSGMSGPLILERRPHPAFAPTVAALRATGLPVEVLDDLAPEQWTKLLVNLNNAISALSGAPTQRLLLDPGYRRAVALVIEEALSVLKAAKVQPAKLRGVPVAMMPLVLRMPTPLVRLVTRAQMKVDPEARSSMWEDLTQGRPTEVDYLNGEIVRLAERVGVDAPVNRRIVDLIHDAEDSRAGSPRMDAPSLLAVLRAGG